MIAEGREGREKYGSLKHKKLGEKEHSTTNEEKRKKKAFAMVAASRSVRRKNTSSLQQKSKKLRNHIDRSVLSHLLAESSLTHLILQDQARWTQGEQRLRNRREYRIPLVNCICRSGVLHLLGIVQNCTCSLIVPLGKTEARVEDVQRLTWSRWSFSSYLFPPISVSPHTTGSYSLLSSESLSRLPLSHPARGTDTRCSLYPTSPLLLPPKRATLAQSLHCQLQQPPPPSSGQSLLKLRTQSTSSGSGSQSTMVEVGRGRQWGPWLRGRL